MIEALIKALGLQTISAYELAVATLIAGMIVMLLGMIIDGVSNRTSFGPFLNAALLMGLMIAGLWVVRHVPVLTACGGMALFCGAVGFASLAFLTLTFAKVRITR